MRYLMFLAALLLMAAPCFAGTKIVETDDQIIVEITGTPDPLAQQSQNQPVAREQSTPPASAPGTEQQQPKKDLSVNGRKTSAKDVEKAKADAEARRLERERRQFPLSKPFSGPGSN